MSVPFLFDQNTAETSHQEQRGLWEAFKLSALLLVCARWGSVPLRSGGSAGSLPLDLPHHRSSRGVPWGKPASCKPSGESSHYTFHAFLLQQEEEYRQPVHNKVYEEAFWTAAGSHRSPLPVFMLDLFFWEVFWSLDEEHRLWLQLFSPSDWSNRGWRFPGWHWGWWGRLHHRFYSERSANIEQMVALTHLSFLLMIEGWNTPFW